MKAKAYNWAHSCGGFYGYIDEKGKMHIEGKSIRGHIAFAGKDLKFLASLVNTMLYDYIIRLESAPPEDWKPR